MMGSNTFINWSLTSLNTSYRILGKSITNLAIKPFSNLMLGGETIENVLKVQDKMAKKGIKSLSGFIVEGLINPTEADLDHCLDYSLEVIEKIS